MTHQVPGNGHEQAAHRRLMRFGSHADPATPMWEERGTTVQAVAGHLARLWDTQAAPTDGASPLVTEKGSAHARASVLNLIVIVVDDAAADRVVATLGGLGVRRQRYVVDRDVARFVGLHRPRLRRRRRGLLRDRDGERQHGGGGVRDQAATGSVRRSVHHR